MSIFRVKPVSMVNRTTQRIEENVQMVVAQMIVVQMVVVHKVLHKVVCNVKSAVNNAPDSVRNSQRCAYDDNPFSLCSIYTKSR